MATIETAAAPVVEQARSDLVRRYGVPSGTVEVVSVEPRQWADASLGCPAPGQVYAAVITPGYRIVLTQGGREYVYHASRNDAVPCTRGE